MLFIHGDRQYKQSGSNNNTQRFNDVKSTVFVCKSDRKQKYNENGPLKFVYLVKGIEFESACIDQTAKRKFPKSGQGMVEWINIYQQWHSNENEKDNK